MKSRTTAEACAGSKASVLNRLDDEMAMRAAGWAGAGAGADAAVATAEEELALIAVTGGVALVEAAEEEVAPFELEAEAVELAELASDTVAEEDFALDAAVAGVADLGGSDFAAPADEVLTKNFLMVPPTSNDCV
jgi:hypothetical protein